MVKTLSQNLSLLMLCDNTEASILSEILTSARIGLKIGATIPAAVSRGHEAKSIVLTLKHICVALKSGKRGRPPNGSNSSGKI